MDLAPRVDVRLSQRYGAAPDLVFGAWLDPGITARWLFATASRPMVCAAMDARVRGSFRFVDREPSANIEYAGVYLEISRPRRLAFTLCIPHLFHSRTRVTVEFAAPKEFSSVHGGCGLILVHEDVPAEHAAGMERRWTGMLYGLGEILEAQLVAGVDFAPRRATRR